MNRGGPWQCGLAALLLICLAVAAARAETAVPRIVVALFDGREEGYAFTRLHRPAEMPLNHLGLVIIPHDISTGLPPEELMRDARGIVTWYASEPVKDPAAYIEWLDRQTAAGKRYVMIGDIGFPNEALDALALRTRFDRVMARIGIVWRGSWVSLTYAKRVAHKDTRMVEFERPYPKLLPVYARTDRTADARAFLSLVRLEDSGTDDLVVVGPGGGYIAAHYAALLQDSPPIVRAWYVNPFRFFRAAFATDDIPKPDTTTLSGRRIFYSHIDGDAWHNVASLEAYGARKVSAAEVVLDQIIAKYPDLPVTVAPLSADLDVTWYGDEAARQMARRIFDRANVEAGSHTHSHPFAWGFFRNYQAKNEVPFLRYYPPRPGRTQRESVWDAAGADAAAGQPAKPVDGVYERPRSYAVKPFDIGLEIAGSVRIIQELLPPGKRVEVMQWSGDVSPWAEVIEDVGKLGIRNINGGDSRMDSEFDSYAWVAPVGRRVGNVWQVYSSSANENVYTDLWRRRFYAYRMLVESLKNTESPIRLKPINVYYHFYSAERPEGLNALHTILDYVRTQQIAPVTTSRFAAMADGFFTARLVSVGERSWRIENRDGVETLRFDDAAMLSVDFAKSEGVIGQRHLHGSLYVALDGVEDRPVVTLKDEVQTHRDPDANMAYLVESRWRVKNLQRSGGGWSFDAEGFGRGDFVWKVPAAGRYVVAFADGMATVDAEAGADGLLRFSVPVPGEHGVEIRVRPEGARK